MYGKIVQIFALLFFCSCLAKNFDQKTKLKSVVCKSNASDYVKYNKCKISVTRNSSSFDLDISVLKPVNYPLNVRAMIYYKYGQIYRSIIPLPHYEVCSTLKNLNNAHPVLLTAFDILGESFKPLLRGCPYEGRYNVSIVVDPKQFPSIIPSGMYKIEVFLRVAEKKWGSVIVQAEIVSSIRTSF